MITQYTYIFIPLYFNIILLKNKTSKNVFIYNNYYFLKINVNDKNIFINSETNSLKIELKRPNKNVCELKEFNKFLKSINSYFYFKIRFKGKGYKISFFKKNKLIKFFFGSSHIQMFILKKISLKKLSKYKFLLKSTNLNNLIKLSNKMINVRKINFYTLRGIRGTKAILIKRKGRKGAWT